MARRSCEPVADIDEARSCYNRAVVAKLVQATEFFVVGGPVQADRPCYVERRADQDLLNAVVDQRFAYVLAARGSGKSSLMIHTIRELRSEGYLAAVIDLTQIGARGESQDASRWFYSIAHRIVRELRLKVDLQTWWQERSALAAEQRFGDFLWEIVLSNTNGFVTIFFDEIERAIDLPFAVELFSVIRDCYSLRVSEPDYARLNFVVLGVASPSRLCPDVNSSPFVIGDAIQLTDFSVEECYQFAPGFELGEDTARGLLDRVYGWTNGQPYLTQKISRAVSRRGGRLEDVERAVNELFLTTSAIDDEPLLNHIQSLLTARRPMKRSALQLLARIAKGASVQADLSTGAQEALWLAGVIGQDEHGKVVVRNRIYRAIFTEKWAKSAMPFNWRGVAVAAAVAFATIFVPYWYLTYLPDPYIATLSNVDVTDRMAEDAYAKLHRLPGFAATADNLYAEVLARQSRRAESLSEITAINTVLDGLEGHEGLPTLLRGEFWVRKAIDAINNEERDAALLYAIQGMDGQDEKADALVRELIGADYQRLQRSFHLQSAPARWAVDWASRSMTIVDADHQARIVGLDDASAKSAESLVDGGLTALELIPLSRELSVDRDGSSGSFDLQVTMDHPVASDLTVTLTAPSGVAVTLPLTDKNRTADGFNLTSRSPLELAVLADEQRQGVWRLTLVDGNLGSSGTLHRWTLQFDDVAETWLGAPELGIPIPDPVRTNDVDVRLSRDGRLAVARTAREGAMGALAIWDLSTGTLNSDVRLDASPDFVEFTPDSKRLVAMSGNTLVVWDAIDGKRTVHVETQTEFLLPPAVSAEGSYVAISEQVEGSAPLFSLIRTADGAHVASVEGVRDVEAWVLAPEARYLALLSSGRQIDIMDPRRGAIVTELTLDRQPTRVIPIVGDDLLLTVDDTGDVRAWRFAFTPDGLSQVDNWRLGTTVDADSISVATDASTVAFSTVAGHVAVHDLSRTAAPLLVRADKPNESIETRVSPDGQVLLTANDSLLRLWNLSDREPDDGVDPELTVLAIGEEGRIAATGYRGGYVRAKSLVSLTQPQESSIDVDFIGHRGPVTAIALNTGQNLIASGGNDGVVRSWNLASVSPSDAIMRHPSGPILAIAISGDGRWIASAAESSARVWRVETGELAAEYPVNGTARSVAFSSDGSVFAVGDSAGNLFIGPPDADSPRLSLRADSAIESIAFSSDASIAVTGDDLGNVRVWNTAESSATARSLKFKQTVHWLGFERGDEKLLVQTDQWIHRLDVTETELKVLVSRLLPANLEPGAAQIDTPEETIRLIGGVDAGRTMFAEFAFHNVVPDSPLALSATTLYRDWSSVLGFELNATGVATPIVL